MESLILEYLPHYTVIKEYFIKYKNTRLFFDFYLPEILIAFEAQGSQHNTFIGHFHGDSLGFKKSKHRDRLKKEWAEINNVRVVEFYESDKNITKEEFFSKIFGEQC